MCVPQLPATNLASFFDNKTIDYIGYFVHGPIESLPALLDPTWMCIPRIGSVVYNPYTYISKDWLVVSTPLKNMSSSVGMMKFPIYGKIKAMFQTTKQQI